MYRSNSRNSHLTGPQVCARYGGISHMTLWRWLQDHDFKFPRPLVLKGRRYWKLGDLEAWERSRATMAEAA